MRIIWMLAVALMASQTAIADDCVDCHVKVSPNIVTDWENSKHHQENVDCRSCHKGSHESAEDVANIRTVTAKTCGRCHEERLEQFSRGEHALAWAAVNAMPTTHALPMALTQGMKGCGGCHKLGLKSDEEIATLKAEGSVFGHASCDACHTRHTFSAVEASEPQACQTCHMGFDHPQWEMWSSSKHGVRYLLTRRGLWRSEGDNDQFEPLARAPDGDPFGKYDSFCGARLIAIGDALIAGSLRDGSLYHIVPEP